MININFTDEKDLTIEITGKKLNIITDLEYIIGAIFNELEFTGEDVKTFAKRLKVAYLIHKNFDFDFDEIFNENLSQ